MATENDHPLADALLLDLFPQLANPTIRTAVQAVLKERAAQDAKWGEQNHDPFVYLVVLMEEVGELSQAVLHARYGGHAAAGVRTEAVQVAAVALALIECLYRGKWRWGSGALPVEAKP